MIAGPASRVVAGFFACALFATLPAAQKIKVESQRDEKADFTALRTYSWLPSPPIKSGIAPDAVTDPTLSQDVLGPHIVSAVDRELTARGLTRSEQAEPDVHVVYYAALAVDMSTSELGSYLQYTTGWSLPPMGASTNYIETVERGTIIVDLVAHPSKRAIWRGTVATNVNHENSLDKRIARINEAMARVFERFPLRPVRKR
jgi:Domain of unknown function (DUF4136)